MTLSVALHGTFKEMRKDNTVGISVQTCSDIFDSNVMAVVHDTAFEK